MPKYALEGVYITGYQFGGAASKDAPDSFDFKDMKKGGDNGYTEVEWTYDANDRANSADPLPTEDFTMNYEKVEWTYDEGVGYTATDDLFT